MDQHIVVIFGSEAEGWCNLNHCPMEAFGPFDTSAEAHAFMETWPPAFMAHCLRLSAPMVNEQPFVMPTESASG